LSIAVDNVVKRFGNFAALNGVSLEAKPGEFLALLGPSGSGKTTLLRIMAGLEFPDSGTVLFEGQDVTGLGVRDRRIGFVFQHYALFPHMNVADNVAFGLTVKRRRERPKRAEIVRRAQELLDLVQLGHLGKRYPAQLSGGQRQRVALARALAVEPRLLLLDEPFGALDAKVRKELRRWLRDLHDRMGLTSVFVTHDQEEALELADRVVVMDQGLIEQVAGPQIIYDEPATAFVYDFVGDSNRIPVTIDEGRVMFAGEALDVPVDSSPDGPALLYFRPHDATLVDEGAAGALPMQICQAIHLGGVTRIEGNIPGVEPLIDVRIPGRNVPPAGRAAGLRLRRARLFPAPGGGGS
jgi:sulfate/thiosulfate transport system ATP-binding protein